MFLTRSVGGGGGGGGGCRGLIHDEDGTACKIAQGIVGSGERSEHVLSAQYRSSKKTFQILKKKKRD